MRVATVEIEGVSPYSQSKKVETPRKPKESANDHEARTWRERIHQDREGKVFIPPMAFKKALQFAAQRSGRQVDGRGKATYTKHVKGGVLIMDPVHLGITADDVQGEWLFLDANGKPGGTRVSRCMPKVDEGWRATLTIYVVDDTVTDEVLADFLREAGMFVGIGRFRPENGGYYGRFKVTKISFAEMEAAA